MTQALAGALTATQDRLALGIAEAEAELAKARARCRELRETVALARAREAAGAVAPPPERTVRELHKQARIAKLTETILSETPGGRSIPRRWIPALGAIVRLDADRFPGIFTRNAILHWSGEGALSGLHLGSAKAAEVAAAIARHIILGSIRVEEMTGADENLDVVAHLTFANPDGPPLETTIHGVFRFDDAGKIALLYLTPYQAEAVDEILRSAG